MNDWILNMVLRDASASKNNFSTFPTSNQVGKTPEEKIEPDKLDGDVDTSEAIWFVNSKSFSDNHWSIEEIQFYWELMSYFFLWAKSGQNLVKIMLTYLTIHLIEPSYLRKSTNKECYMSA